MDLGHEQVDEAAMPYRLRVPARERTRRGMLVGLTVAFALVFLLQVGFAVMGGPVWDRVGPVLSAATTLVGTGFGFAWGYYYSKD